MTPETTDSTTEFTPATQPELARFVGENAAGSRRSLCPAGGRTALHYGFAAPADVTICMSELNRIVDYPARDMTVTVEAGLRIDELAGVLGAEGQRLPIDVAQSHRATLGGVIATNTSGPRRFGFGTLRDYLIGVTAVTAEGRTFHSGGRVVKNVAGYDLCKLLAGSRGTLAIMTQVTLKLRPQAESSAFLWATFDLFGEIENVLQKLLVSEARPVAVEALSESAARLVVSEARCDLPTEKVVLCLGVEGTARETEWQLETLRRELAPYNPQESVQVEDASAMWKALTEFQICADDPLTFQANLLPSRCLAFAEEAAQLGVAVQAHAGNGIVVGKLPDEASTLAQTTEILDRLRPQTRACRGNLVVLDCASEWKASLPVCGAPEPSWPLMQRLKATLDPHQLLNPGRFIDARPEPAAAAQAGEKQPLQHGSHD